jgi:hypothetical protein
MTNGFFVATKTGFIGKLPGGVGRHWPMAVLPRYGSGIVVEESRYEEIVE